MRRFLLLCALVGALVLAGCATDRESTMGDDDCPERAVDPGGAGSSNAPGGGTTTGGMPTATGGGAAECPTPPRT